MLYPTPFLLCDFLMLALEMSKAEGCWLCQNSRNSLSHHQLPGSWCRGKNHCLFHHSKARQEFWMTVLVKAVSPNHPQWFWRVSSEKETKIRMAFTCSSCATCQVRAGHVPASSVIIHHRMTSATSATAQGKIFNFRFCWNCIIWALHALQTPEKVKWWIRKASCSVLNPSFKLKHWLDKLNKVWHRIELGKTPLWLWMKWNPDCRL